MVGRVLENLFVERGIFFDGEIVLGIGAELPLFWSNEPIPFAASRFFDPHSFSRCRCGSGDSASAAEGPEGKKIGSIPHGFNRTENHDLLVQAYEPLLKVSAEAGFKQVICFSGNREGLSEEQGLENCALGLKRLLTMAEKLGVTLVMELLNSKVNHPDYMCDHSAWGVALCEKLGTPHFKLLYDIYHMQIMEGDVIATIKKHHAHFAHYHTGGVPGRAEIDETQELNYSAIIRAIQSTGYTGCVGQEFIPKRADKMGSLKQAVKICTVA